MKFRMFSNPRSYFPLASAIAAMLAPQTAHGQTTRTWNGTTGSAWLTTGSWTPSGTFAGNAPNAVVTGEGATNDIMTVSAANSATNVGINMGTLSGLLSLGGIDFNKTSTATLQIGNSSTTVNGILQLNGATINSVPKTLIRVAGSANLNIANVNTGTGTQTMGLRLGITDGVFDVGTGRTLTISSIVSEASANSGFTKTGAGTLTLGGANTYTGATVISEGILQINNANALGTTPGTNGSSQISIASGANLYLSADTTIAAPVVASSGSTISFGRTSTANGTFALNGSISGGDVSFSTNTVAGSNGQLQTLSLGAAGSYTGTTTITAGHFQAGMSVRNASGAANVLPTGTVLNFVGTAGGGTGRVSTFDLNGQNQELAGLTNSAASLRLQRVTSSTAATLTINNPFASTFGNISGSGNAQITGAISLAKSGAATFTLLGDQPYTGTTTINAGVLRLGDGGTTGRLTATTSITNDGNLTINRSNGFSQDTDLGAGVAIAGTGSFTQAGSGTTTLTAVNTYSGPTAVTAGTLVVNGSITASNVTVSGSGTLQGSGSIGGSVTIDSGGTLASGNSIESLGTGNLSFASGSTFAYEFQTGLYAGTPNVAGDLTASTGTLDISSGAILTLTELATTTSLALGSKLTLISYFGGWTGAELFTYNSTTLADGGTVTLGANTWEFDYNDTTGGPNFTLDQSGATRFVTMTVVVPEPGAALLGGLGLLALLRRRR